MRRRNAIGREGPGDVSKGPRGSVLTTDPVDDRAWEHDRASGRTSRRARAGRLDVLRNEALEFVDRNETLTPRGLDRVDRRHNSAVDRGDAYAESLSRLAATIGVERTEPLAAREAGATTALGSPGLASVGAPGAVFVAHSMSAVQ